MLDRLITTAKHVGHWAAELSLEALADAALEATGRFLGYAFHLLTALLESMLS